MHFPEFKYHPDPIHTGNIITSNDKCICCGNKTGYIYIGPIFSKAEIHRQICPYCISNGLAHQKFDAEFTDYSGIGDYGRWDEVENSIKEEIAFRTPGFIGWQQTSWWTHCHEGGIFLGNAGKEEIQNYGNQLIIDLKSNSGIPENNWDSYFNVLSKNDSPTAYIFKCNKCGKLGGYTDSD